MNYKGNYKIQLSKNELEYRYLILQQPSTEIAKVLNCSSPTIVAMLKRYGIPNRGLKEASNTIPEINRMREMSKGNTYCRGKYKIKLNEKDIRYRYLELQQSTKDIAKLFKCSHPTILSRLRLYGIPIRSSKDAHNVKPYLQKFTIDIPKQELYEKYIINKLTMTDIRKEYNCSMGCVRNNLRRYNITIRSESENQKMLFALGRRKPPIVTKEVRRQATINIYKNPISHIKTSKAGKKYHKEHPDFSAKQTIRLRSYRNNPEIMKRMIESFKKTTNNPEYKEKISQRFKGMWLDPTYKAKMVEIMKQRWADKGNPKCIQMRKNMMAGMNLRPNKPETIVLNILNDSYPSQWKYTGDGQVIIGGLNPDFININGKKLIIELFGDYWHTQKLKPYRVNEGRVDVYAEYGYKTLIIWERETKDIDVLKHKIDSFVEY